MTNDETRGWRTRQVNSWLVSLNADPLFATFLRENQGYRKKVMDLRKVQDWHSAALSGSCGISLLPLAGEASYFDKFVSYMQCIPCVPLNRKPVECNILIASQVLIKLYALLSRAYSLLSIDTKHMMISFDTIHYGFLFFWDALHVYKGTVFNDLSRWLQSCNSFVYPGRWEPGSAEGAATPAGISVRDEFRSGGLKSLARIFPSIACMKIKWFVRILPDLLPENGYLKNSRGLQPPSAPWAVRLCPLELLTNPKNEKICQKGIYFEVRTFFVTSSIPETPHL